MTKLQAAHRILAARPDDKQALIKELQEISDKIDDIVRSGGKVALNDPLSKKLKGLQQRLQKLKKQQ